MIVSKEKIKQVIEISEYKRDYLNWSIGYIDLAYQFNTPEYHQDNLEEHLLKTYAKGGNFESKSKTGFLVKFRKSIVSAHGKITYKLAELSSKDRFCEEWCKNERFRNIGRSVGEISAIVANGILIAISSPVDVGVVEKAIPFFAGLFVKINKKLDDYCNCIEKIRNLGSKTAKKSKKRLVRRKLKN